MKRIRAAVAVLAIVAGLVLPAATAHANLCKIPVGQYAFINCG